MSELFFRVGRVCDRMRPTRDPVKHKEKTTEEFIMKRIVSILLSAALLLSLFSISALAEESAEASWPPRAST